MRNTKSFYLLTIFLISFLPSVIYSCQSEGTSDTSGTNEYLTKRPVQIDFDKDSIIFSFSDTDGQNILTIDDSLPDPNIYTKTISTDGSLIPVTFTTKKRGTKGKDFRKTYYNFSNCGGYLFKCKNKKVDFDRTNLLISNKFLLNRKFLGIPSPETKPLNKVIADTLQEIKHRKIKSSFPLVKLGKDATLYIVNFEVVNDTAMYSLVLVKPNKLAFQDNYAKYEPDGTWRVDDGGIIDPSAFQVLAQFSSEHRIEFVLDWIGTEGYFTQYIIENGNQLEMVKNGYRYAAPQ